MQINENVKSAKENVMEFIEALERKDVGEMRKNELKMNHTCIYNKNEIVLGLELALEHREQSG